MRHLLILVLSLLITTPAFAEMWICYDDTTKKITKRVNGDCKTLGLCSGFNNTGLQANCFEAKVVEWSDSRLANKKIDPSNPTNKVIDLTQVEIDAETTKAQADADASAKAAADNLDVSVKDVMTAFINVYNKKMTIESRITTKELKDQIKVDKGLTP